MAMILIVFTRGSSLRRGAQAPLIKTSPAQTSDNLEKGHSKVFERGIQGESKKRGKLKRDELN
jgi:hypothetical protein